MSGPFSGVPHKPAPGSRRNSLGLGERELGALLEELDAESRPGGAASARKYVRRPFARTSLPLQVAHHDGTVANILVACRNISQRGMSVLHSAFLHTGSRCLAALPHPTGEPVIVRGSIVRCTHRKGIVHELGIEFERDIDPGRILELDPLSDWFTLERVQPRRLIGDVVCVDASSTDQRILRHHLRETSLNVRLYSSAIEALAELGSKKYDLLITAYLIAEMTGVELIQAMRDRAIETPAVLYTAEDPEVLRPDLLRCKANAFLAMPIDRVVLFRAIAEFLTHPDGKIAA